MTPEAPLTWKEDVEALILGPRVEQPCSCDGCDCENALAAEVLSSALTADAPQAKEERA